MKYNEALKAAKAEAKKNPGTIFVIVNEGIHNPDREFSADCDDPSFGYCPLGGEQMLYRYGAVVSTVKAHGNGGAVVLDSENHAELMTMKAEALLARLTAHLPKPAKWKLQLAAPFGWGDVKTSEDGAPYVVELFDTQAAACEEMAAMGGDGLRVVLSTVEQDVDLYEEASK